MVTVPAAIPVTTPVEEPIVAIAGLLLLHRPPGVISLRVVDVPVQVLVAPVMGDTDIVTVSEV